MDPEGRIRQRTLKPRPPTPAPVPGPGWHSVLVTALAVVALSAAMLWMMGCSAKVTPAITTDLTAQVGAVNHRTQQIYEFTKGAKTKIDNSRSEVTWKLVAGFTAYLVTSKLANWLLVCFPRNQQKRKLLRALGDKN